MQSTVRRTAPYLPSNLDFIQEVNSLSAAADVIDIMTAAEYMVLGLGDVYLSAPCAIPVNPLHRLSVPKYNPARTYTPEGAVGIGGSTMCIYGMNSPGGYQLVGRTVPIWDNTKRQPWFLKSFDRVSFYRVSPEEIEPMRAQFRNGEFELQIEDGEFSLTRYISMVKACEEDTRAFRAGQKVVDLTWGQDKTTKVLNFLASTCANDEPCLHRGRPTGRHTAFSFGKPAVRTARSLSHRSFPGPGATLGIVVTGRHCRQWI